MKKLLLLSTMFCLALLTGCTKEIQNQNPTKPSNFVIEYGGSDVEFRWKASTDADGNAVTYDISVLDVDNSTPKSIAVDVATNSFTTTTFPSNIPQTMIVRAKDGKGGEATGVEKATIYL